MKKKRLAAFKKEKRKNWHGKTIFVYFFGKTALNRMGGVRMSILSRTLFRADTAAYADVLPAKRILGAQAAAMDVFPFDIAALPVCLSLPTPCHCCFVRV